MTKTEEKPTITNKSKKEKKPKQVKTAKTNAAIFTLLFLLFITTSGTVYWLWENYKNNLIQQQNSTLSVNKQLSDLKKQQQELASQNIRQIESIQTFQKTLRENLTKTVQNNQYFRNDWLISEAEYLVQLANYRLLLEKDVTTAIVALKAADARLAEISNPALLKIRTMLKNDLQALNNVKTIDLSGISITISALSNNISNLPLLTPDPKTHKLTQIEDSKASADVKGIKQLPAAIWKDIKSLIIVRNHQKLIKPLLSTEQHFFLLQNLTLLFEQTRLSLLNSNNIIYQERLLATAQWVKQYFDPDHNITRNMLSSIESLQSFDINPTLPDISATFSSLRKYRTQGKAPEITMKAKVKQ